MKNQKGSGYLNSQELALSQECFETILAGRNIYRTSDEATAIAAALFRACRVGIVNKADLIELADIPDYSGPETATFEERPGERLHGKS